MSNLCVLVLGSGGREHALARGLVADPTVAEVHVAPGNPGTAAIATNHDIDPLNAEAVISLAKEIGATFVVVGPEAPLAAGIADALLEANIAVFGPTKASAQLETSKSFAKHVMAEAGVPTGRSFTCETEEQVAHALSELGAPYVVKHDGLAAGKGVIVTSDLEEAIDHAAKADRVVIEEFLDGPELSLFVITDGQYALPMMPAQDFKREGDGDQGRNTGGMGAYSPLPWLPETTVDEVIEKVATPTLDYLRAQGTPFVGLLYIGLALTKDGPKVIEFNARFGDPETQVLIPTLVTPLGQVLHAAATGRLADFGRIIFEGAAVGVVMAAEGYPGTPNKGCHIDLPPDDENAHIIQAGTSRDPDGDLIADGGRVLTVVGCGSDVKTARKNAYQRVDLVDFVDGVYRSDIASDKKLSGAGLLKG